jgi:hypothetical protein
MKSWAYTIAHIKSYISIYMKLHMLAHSHELMHSKSTQAHCLAKVFNLPEIRYLDMVSLMVNKSGVLHPNWAYRLQKHSNHTRNSQGNP